MRKLTEYPVEGPNALWTWTKIKNPLKVALNFAVIYICRYVPSLRLKNAFYRSIGIKIGKNVSIGLEATFDIFFPELIEIGDNSVIGYKSTLLCHEFLVDRWSKGGVKIGKNVLIGANSTILAGVSIGDNSTISACSLVNKEMPEGVFVGGVPAKELTRGTNSWHL
jgi:acetyltransferase-like isoleucine patch superfamily enzyme